MFKEKNKAKKKSKPLGINITKININGGNSVISELILDKLFSTRHFFFDNYHQGNL